MKSSRANANAPSTVQMKLDDSAVNKDKIPAPAELSELMGRSMPGNAYSELGSSREWGKMTGIFSMTFQNIQSLPSLRGKKIQFTTTDGVQKKLHAEPKDLLLHAVSHPSTIFKTLPFWQWDAPVGDESKTKNFFSNVLSNIVMTPNIIYGFTSTMTEIAAKTVGSTLTQPFHYLWKGMKFADEKDPKTNQKLGFFSRLAKSIPSVFTQPFKNIKEGWNKIKKNWSDFATENKDAPLWKKIGKGIGLGIKTVAQTVGLAIAAFPPVSWPLAIAGWAAGQTLLYASNALGYVRYFIDGLTTLAVNAPKALMNDPDKITICKSAAKTMGKSALLLLPTAVILTAAVLIPGAQILPAIAPVMGAKILAACGIGATGAQLASGLINYKFAEANLKKAQALTAASSSNQQIARTIAAKSAVIAQPKLDVEKVPLLASHHPDSPSQAAAPSPKRVAEAEILAPTIIAPATTTAVPTQQILATAAHQSMYVELQNNENMREKIRDLRKAFLHKKPHSSMPGVRAVIADEDHHDAMIPRVNNPVLHHEHLRWNEHQENAWTEYRRSDKHQYISEVMAISNDINPQRILPLAIQDAALRATLKPTLKAGIKQLRAAGAPLNKENLFALVQNEALAQTLADHYKTITRQTITNRYTHANHEYPSDKFIDLAIRQVDGFINMHGARKTLTISAAWDASYVEAILLYAATRNYKCKNKSAFAVSAFSATHVDVFKDLLDKKPYLGNRNSDPKIFVTEEKLAAPTDPRPIQQ
jgi:hypothetical protein